MAERHRKDKKQEAQSPHRNIGGGQPLEDGHEQPKWTVIILGPAKKEGHKILSDPQYQHIREILKRLVDYGNEEEIGDIQIEPIQSFYELKEKGGILGSINLRVFFGTIPEVNEIVVAKTYKKEEEGALPRHVIIVVEDRLEEYRIGRMRKGITVYEGVRLKE